MKKSTKMEIVVFISVALILLFLSFIIAGNQNEAIKDCSEEYNDDCRTLMINPNK